MRVLRILSVAVMLFSSSLVAQTTSKLTAADLAAITERGRILQDYDQASWHATDAVQALHPAEGSVARYIAQKTDAGWVVAFGRFDENKDAFLIPYEATEGKSLTDFSVKTYDPPRKDTGYFFIAALAIETALDNSVLADRPYNTYVIPQNAGQLYVYVLPAQTVDGIYPLGGDTRFLIGADGTRILDIRRLHKTILEIDTTKPPGKKLAAMVHGHVLTDTPEDTDVFHVLRQTNPVPEIIHMPNGAIYEVETDGTITAPK
jgi:hypothetical protein